MRIISQQLIETARHRMISGISPTPVAISDPSPRVRMLCVDACLAEAQEMAAQDPQLSWLLVAEAHAHLERAMGSPEPLLMLFGALDLCEDHPQAAWAIVAGVRRCLQSEAQI